MVVFFIAVTLNVKKELVWDNMFITCSKHKSSNLTSNTDETLLPESARILIAQIKAYEEDKRQQLILDLQAANASGNTVSFHGETLLGDDEESELQAVKTEIALLRELNAELKDKNELLKQLIKCNNSNTTTYTEVLSEKPKMSKKVPSITVKSKEAENTQSTYNSVTNAIQNNVSIPIKNVYSKKDGSVIIKCLHEEDVSSTMNILKDKLP